MYRYHPNALSRSISAASRRTFHPPLPFSSFSTLHSSPGGVYSFVKLVLVSVSTDIRWLVPAIRSITIPRSPNYFSYVAKQQRTSTLLIVSKRSNVQCSSKTEKRPGIDRSNHLERKKRSRDEEREGERSRKLCNAANFAEQSPSPTRLRIALMT